MKHTIHQDRKSFKKWALPGQRVMTETLEKKISKAARKRIQDLLNIQPHEIQ